MVSPRTIASDGSASEGGGANPATGYAIISANDIDETVEQAKGCPIPEGGGSIEVTKTFEVM